MRQGSVGRTRQSPRIDRSEIWETLRVWVQIPRRFAPRGGWTRAVRPTSRTYTACHRCRVAENRAAHPAASSRLAARRQQKLPTQVPVLPSRHSQRRAARAALRVRVRQVRGRRRRAHCAAAFATRRRGRLLSPPLRLQIAHTHQPAAFGRDTRQHVRLHGTGRRGMLVHRLHTTSPPDRRPKTPA